MILGGYSIENTLGGTTTQYQKFFRNIETFNITQKQLDEAAEIAAKSTTPEKAAQLFYDEIVKAADTNKVFTRNQLENIPVVNNNDQKRMIADQIEENRRIKEELDGGSKENGNLGESSLDVNQTGNLLSREVLMSYEFYGIRAVRIKEGTNGKVAIIGQSMGDFAKRGEYGVVDYARELRARGYETELFAGPRITREARDELDDLRAEFGRDLTPSELEKTIAYKENMAWAKWVKEEGFTVIDIGNPNNKAYSHFYNGECINIFGN